MAGTYFLSLVHPGTTPLHHGRKLRILKVGYESVTLTVPYGHVIPAVKHTLQCSLHVVEFVAGKQGIGPLSVPTRTLRIPLLFSAWTETAH